MEREGQKIMNQINVVTIGKLIEAHREGDEQKFKTYVDFIVKAYEEQENDRAARIIRSSYTGDYGEQGKVVLDEAGEQTVYYETGWYEPDVLGSGGSYLGVTKATSEEEALQRLLKHSADYAHRITLYKKDGITLNGSILTSYKALDEALAYTVSNPIFTGENKEIAYFEVADLVTICINADGKLSECVYLTYSPLTEFLDISAGWMLDKLYGHDNSAKCSIDYRIVFDSENRGKDSLRCDAKLIDANTGAEIARYIGASIRGSRLISRPAKREFLYHAARCFTARARMILRII